MPAILHYEKIIPPEILDNYKGLNDYFLDCINPIWLDLYELNIVIAGEYCNIDYYGYNFLFDDTGQWLKGTILQDAEKQVPRVVGAYGYSRIDNLQNEGNRSRLRGLFKMKKA